MSNILKRVVVFTTCDGQTTLRLSDSESSARNMAYKGVSSGKYILAYIYDSSGKWRSTFHSCRPDTSDESLCEENSKDIKEAIEGVKDSIFRYLRVCIDTSDTHPHEIYKAERLENLFKRELKNFVRERKGDGMSI